MLLAYMFAALLVSSVPSAAQGQSPEQLYREAVAADERGDISQAISLYEKLIKLQPDSVPVRADLAVALVHVGRYPEAVAQYQEALKRDPENPVVQLNLGLAWYKQADFEKAAAEFETLRRKNPTNQQSLYLLADCYLRLGRNSEASALLEPAFQADSGDRAVDYALGMALIRQGRIQEGQVVIDRILKDGNTPEANLLMGEAQLAAGDYKTATSTLRKALDLNPSLPEGWSLYGRALLESQDKDGAKTAFQRGLQVDANDFTCNLNLGALLRHDGNNAEAVPYLEHALRLRPRSPEARFQVGALNMAQGKLEQARKEFEQIEREWPDFLEVHVQLASVYSRMNLKQESQRERDIVLRFNEKARENKPSPER
jgi:tetratricopeptide (TPR) repeat protein